jgi:hypothetical protein
MSVPKHLAEAAAKLKEASFRIDEARHRSCDLRESEGLAGGADGLLPGAL